MIESIRELSAFIKFQKDFRVGSVLGGNIKFRERPVIP